jgi:hypothetical protein
MPAATYTAHVNLARHVFHGALLAWLITHNLACAHRMVVETEPASARISVDGEVVGTSPVVIERVAFIGDTLGIKVEADNHEPSFVAVPASEWNWWPAALALVPLAGLPLVVIPVIGPVLTVVWAIGTSPTLLSLAFVRRYPEHVQVRLKPKRSDVILPLDIFDLPDEAPNPVPLGAPGTTPPATATPIPNTPPGK